MQTIDTTTPLPATPRRRFMSGLAGYMDKPTLTIIRLVIGALGIYGALTGTGVPPVDLTATYFDGNPFEAKALVIREYLAFWFAMVVMLSVIISILTEVLDMRPRARTSRYYMGVVAVMLVVALGLGKLVTHVGNARARAEWYPQAIRDMTPAFNNARDEVENKRKPTPDYKPLSEEQIRAGRLSQAKETVSQIERLLEVDTEVDDLATRVRALSPRFERQ